MKYLKYILLLILALSYSCERDDICAEATPTTPNASVEFYDVGNPETLKTVPGFYIIGLDRDIPVPGATGTPASAISLPLRTDQESTTFDFYKDIELDDENMIIGGNKDVVTFSYTTEEIYVSRACGFKTIFTNINISVENDLDNWIQTVLFVAENQTIQDESQVHIHIRH